MADKGGSFTHFQRAEEILDALPEHGLMGLRANSIAEAQAHATLALAARQYTVGTYQDVQP